MSIKPLPNFKCKICNEMIPYRQDTSDNGNKDMICDSCSASEHKKPLTISSSEKKDEGWPMGWKASIAVCIALYFFSYVSDEKDLVLTIIASIAFGTILGSFIYLVGGLVWMILVEVFNSSKDYAKSKGVPTPFAVIFGLICGYLFLELIG